MQNMNFNTMAIL